MVSMKSNQAPLESSHHEMHTFKSSIPSQNHMSKLLKSQNNASYFNQITMFKPLPTDPKVLKTKQFKVFDT